MAWEDENKLYVVVCQCGEIPRDLEYKQIKESEPKEEPQGGDDERAEDGWASGSYVDNGHGDIPQGSFGLRRGISTI